MTYWVSCAPESGPDRVCIVDAESPRDAHVMAFRLGVAVPGDELVILALPGYSEPEHRLPRGRLLTQEELDSGGAVRGST